MTPPTVFVTSATGTQGGAVARQLLALGWKVHTTTRNPESKSARALEAIGVKITTGDWDNRTALKEGISGCQMLFLNVYPTLKDPPHELRQARSIMKIAKDAGVKHIIYTSSFAPKGGSHLPHWDPESAPVKARESKRNIEEAVQTAGFEAWTIFRPGWFMVNLLLPRVNMFYPEATKTGLYVLPLLPDTGLPLFDQEDVGRFAAAAFQNPQRFNGQTIELAGEILAVEDAMKLLARASGRNIRAKYLSDEELEQQKGNMLVVSQTIARDMAQMVDLEYVRSWGLKTGTFAEFLEREKDLVEETFRNVEA